MILNASIPIPIAKLDACKDPDSRIHCPLRKNHEFYYTTTMFVPKELPLVSVIIQSESHRNRLMIFLVFCR
ncbi:hypothetical protein EAI_02099 [Harpegnathos saltator]|uniref:MD-2-related lipid-recognition domain-containing protein n=1 Tax=Harpegnathos saltator TaxID=610380 RepID=E2B9X9_HARSA|nr:hypothetical protein EAI_02099 [Harpegnathos saltator]